MRAVAPGTSYAGADDGGFSPVVATIFDTLLSAIHEGRMLPGERISDGRLAEEFQVSRTPVREAIQRLRDLGVVEASASRYTRVATITPLQTAQAMVVWTALYGALVDEVIADVPSAVHDAMTQDHACYLEVVKNLHYPLIANTNFLFFGRLTALSTNPVLTDGLTRVVHLIRLGSLNLPESIDIHALADAQTQLLQAVTDRSVAVGKQAIDRIRAIEIPQE